MDTLVNLFAVFICLWISFPSVFLGTLTDHEVASRIFESLNKDVDPCKDFYEFACGGWIKRNPIPESLNSLDQFRKLKLQIDSKLKELLEADNDDNLPKSAMKVKTLYKACIDTEKLEKDEIEPIQRILEESNLTPRPPVEASANFTWEETVGRARRTLDLTMLIHLEISEDYRNRSRNRIKIGKASGPHLLKPKQSAKESEQDHEIIKSMISLVDPAMDAEKFANDVIVFSKSLEQIKTIDVTQSDNNDALVEFTISQLINGSNGAPKQWKEHDWGRYLTLVFSNTSVTLDPHLDKVTVLDLPSIQKLTVLLSETEPVIIEQYLWWTVFSTFAPLTLSSFRKLKYNMSEAESNQLLYNRQSEICIKYVKDNLDLAVSYLYVKRHVDPAFFQKAIEMLEDIREAFAENVQQLDWIDSATRNKTLIKLKAIRTFVGFPSWLNTRRFEDIEVDGDLIETDLKLRWANVKKNLETLREKPDRNRWSMEVTEVNAAYLSNINSVIIPAGILQAPFYGNGIEAIDYGAIGIVLGHEITHGFDNTGRRFDDKGNLKEWWSASSLEHYNTKVQCIIDQYSKYHVDQSLNYTVNGSSTQGENIADNGSMRASLKAYRTYLERVPIEACHKLPRLEDYSSEQLFFLGFAQIWCQNSTVDYLKWLINNDSHSPGKIRVIGTLSNSKDFAEAWQCPSGSPMNPEHKCVLW